MPARLRHPAAALVLVEGSLERAEEEVALGRVGVDHAQPRIGLPVGSAEGLPDLGYIGELAAHDEELTGR